MAAGDVADGLAGGGVAVGIAGVEIAGVAGLSRSSSRSTCAKVATVRPNARAILTT